MQSTRPGRAHTPASKVYSSLKPKNKRKALTSFTGFSTRVELSKEEVATSLLVALYLKSLGKPGHRPDFDEYLERLRASLVDAFGEHDGEEQFKNLLNLMKNKSFLFPAAIPKTLFRYLQSLATQGLTINPGAFTICTSPAFKEFLTKNDLGSMLPPTLTLGEECRSPGTTIPNASPATLANEDILTIHHPRLSALAGEADPGLRLSLDLVRTPFRASRYGGSNFVFKVTLTPPRRRPVTLDFLSNGGGIAALYMFLQCQNPSWLATVREIGDRNIARWAAPRIGKLALPAATERPPVVFLEAESTDAAILVAKAYGLPEAPDVLTYASSGTCFGAPHDGAYAQEESVTRRATTLATAVAELAAGTAVSHGGWIRYTAAGAALVNASNGADGGVICERPERHVVIKSSQVGVHGEPLIENLEPDSFTPFTESRVAVSKRPDVKQPYSPAEKAQFQNAVRAYLRAARRGAPLVTGPLGGGAFNHPIEELIPLFYDVLSESEFANKFPIVVFAVPNLSARYGTRDRNFDYFQRPEVLARIPNMTVAIRAAAAAIT